MDSKSLDKLNEVSKVAAIKASSSLSKLIQQPVGVAISPGVTLNSDETPTITNTHDKIAGIIAPLSGDLQGVSIMFIPKEPAFLLCDLLLHKKDGETQSFSELEISALTEVANIVIGNFLGPFASPLKLDSLYHHVPNFKYESYQTIIDQVMKKLKMRVDSKLLIEIVISMHTLKLKGFLVFMIEANEMQKAFNQ